MCAFFPIPHLTALTRTQWKSSTLLFFPSLVITQFAARLPMTITPEAVSTNYLHLPSHPCHPPFVLSSFKGSVFIKQAIWRQNWCNSNTLTIVPLTHIPFLTCFLAKRWAEQERDTVFFWYKAQPGKLTVRDDLQDRELSVQDKALGWLGGNAARLTCGKVHDSHGAVSFVNVLPSCSFGPERVYTQISGIHFNINLESKKITTFCSC